MLPFAEILAAIQGINAARSFIASIAALGHQQGHYTDEQIEQIREDAAVTDDEWDTAVAAAKARRAGGGA